MKNQFVSVLFIIVSSILVLNSGCSKAHEPPFYVSLFFDDGWQNQYDEAFPVLNQFNFKATFGIITNKIGLSSGYWQYMDLDSLHKLSDTGMEIASHSSNHIDLSIINNPNIIREEIIDCKTVLENSGFKVSTFIYPFFRYSDTLFKYLAEAKYTCARAGSEVPSTYNPLSTKVKGIYHIPSYDVADVNIDEFAKTVKQAGLNNLVCLTYHFISNEGIRDYTTTSKSAFVEQMQYLNDNGYSVIFLKDYIKANEGKIKDNSIVNIVGGD